MRHRAAQTRRTRRWSPGWDALLTRLAADPANGIAKVDHEAELLRLGGYGEATFALEAARGFEFVGGTDDPPVRPSHHKGTHGYSPEIPEMHASFIAAGRGFTRDRRSRWCG